MVLLRSSVTVQYKPDGITPPGSGLTAIESGVPGIQIPVAGGLVADPLKLPVANGTQLPDYTAYDLLNVPALAAGGSYIDPDSGRLVFKLTGNGVPTAVNRYPDYAAAGPYISYPWGNGNQYTIAMYGDDTTHWLVDFEIGVGTSNYRQLVRQSFDLGAAFSLDRNTPQIIYTLTTDGVLRKIDTVTNLELTEGNFPKDLSGTLPGGGGQQVWLMPSVDDRLFACHDRGLTSAIIFNNTNAQIGAIPANGTIERIASAVINIASSTAADPTEITTTVPHGFTSGHSGVIIGHSSTPSIDGAVTPFTVTGASTFTVPRNVISGGTGGTVQQRFNGEPRFDKAGNYHIGDLSTSLDLWSIADDTVINNSLVWREVHPDVCRGYMTSNFSDGINALPHWRVTFNPFSQDSISDTWPNSGLAHAYHTFGQFILLDSDLPGSNPLKQWMGVSTYDYGSPGTRPYRVEDGIALFTIDGLDVRFLVHHYTKTIPFPGAPTFTNSYWSQPHTNISPDGRLVLWGSNMNDSANIASFIVEVPT